MAHVEENKKALRTNVSHREWSCEKEIEMMKNENDEESDFEECDSELVETSFKPSYVVIAIDTHPLMFKRNKDGKMHFRSCLEACHALAESLIFKSDTRSWSPFAVLLAGEQTALINFQNNILDSINLLKAKSQLTDDELIKEFQRKGELDLSSFFLSCKKLFHDIKTPFYQRSLIYITNDDKPVKNKQTKFTALNEAKTFGGSQIEFEVICTIESFNYKFFYNELFSLLVSPKAEEICIDTEGLTQKLSRSVIMKHNQRSLNFYPFKNDTTRFLKCLKVEFIHPSRLLNTMMTKDGKKVINSNTGVDENTPSFHFKTPDIERAKSVEFDLAEKDALLNYDVPKGITLLYVSNRLIDYGHVLNRPSLIKEDPKEDLPYFKKFWQNCVDMNKVLVCLLKLRQPDKLRYCELIPTKVDGSPMFLLKQLPYGNEITYPTEQDYVKECPNEDQRKAIQNLVDKLTFDFNIKMVPDISLQKKKAYVKAKLLDEPVDEVNDIDFNRDTLDSHLKEVAEEIKNKFNLCGEKKRKAPLQKGPPQKRKN
ncbi:hypothetical protein JTB14_037570 [Gonioctena quinquepunctata]|nr:hypothetical protein JTB14_037570 [Gonioctena quinquepunctata]